MTRLYELDPDYQAAQGILISGGYLAGASNAYRARGEAIQTMYRIHCAYEADPALTPRTMLELTSVNDPARCRARRLNDAIREAEGIAAEMTRRLAAGVIDQRRFDAAMKPLRGRIAAILDARNAQRGADESP